MIIYIVQPGDTIYTIAEFYNVPVERLIQDNGLENFENLVVGQTIVIVYPEQTYTVREGDTLAGIADNLGVTFIQLLRNNPYLSEREFLYPGETIVIRYNNNNGEIATNGYAYPFIDRDILRKTLPFLTYLTVFNYRATVEGDLIDIDDAEIIQFARNYGVAPIMLLSTLTNLGTDSIDVAFSILNNQDIQDRIINNVLIILKEKGYYGLNIYIQYINADNINLVENYITKLTTRLNNEGYPVILTLTPTTFIDGTNVTNGRIDYTILGQTANNILLLSYEWGFSYGPPAAVTSVSTIRERLDYAVTQIPPEKIYLGIPIIGYDWQLPYIRGISRANSLSSDAAIQLAGEVDAVIQYDETAQAPFFTYVSNNVEPRTNHIVWFKDARSIDVLLKLIPEYGFQGTAIWNIMYYFSQLWLVLNSQYEIVNIIYD